MLWWKWNLLFFTLFIDFLYGRHLRLRTLMVTQKSKAEVVRTLMATLGADMKCTNPPMREPENHILYILLGWEGRFWGIIWIFDILCDEGWPRLRLDRAASLAGGSSLYMFVLVARTFNSACSRSSWPKRTCTHSWYLWVWDEKLCHVNHYCLIKNRAWRVFGTLQVKGGCCCEDTCIISKRTAMGDNMALAGCTYEYVHVGSSTDRNITWVDSLIISVGFGCGEVCDATDCLDAVNRILEIPQMILHGFDKHFIFSSSVFNPFPVSKSWRSSCSRAKARRWI